MSAAEAQRVASVTGAACKVGRATAQSLAQQGFAVIALSWGPQPDYLAGQTFHVNGGTYLL